MHGAAFPARVVFLTLCVTVLLAEGVVASTPAAAADEITSLPNAPAVSFKQYGGYVPVTSDGHRQLYYYFVESQRSPSADPVVLWLTGGPGCSSLTAAFTEHGPLLMNKHGAPALTANPYAWNTVANVIYLESPAGVGFSYSSVAADMAVGDARTADDTYAFLLGFFQRFPQFAANDLYIAGESYAGHYTVQAVARILEGNAAGGATQLPIRGHIVGNALTWAELDNEGAVFDWYSHALNSHETYVGLMVNCPFNDIGPLAHGDSAKCDHFQKQAQQEMGGIDLSNIYGPVCVLPSADDATQPLQLLRQLSRASPISRVASEVVRARIEAGAAEMAAHGGGGMPPMPAAVCVDIRLGQWLNTAAVQKSMHATHDMGYKWSGCSQRITYNHTDVMTSVLPVYRTAMEHNMRMLVFSGDVDGIVPVTGTRAWIQSMELKMVTPWRPWTAPDGTVGGYVVAYDGLTFATLRGAGHMASQVKPMQALALFTRYLADQPL